MLFNRQYRGTSTALVFSLSIFSPLELPVQNVRELRLDEVADLRERPPAPLHHAQRMGDHVRVRRSSLLALEKKKDTKKSRVVNWCHLKKNGINNKDKEEKNSGYDAPNHSREATKERACR